MVRENLLGFPSHTLSYRCRNLITLSTVLGEASPPVEERENKENGWGCTNGQTCGILWIKYTEKAQ